jgi:beta-glucoside operon transcriptional antiterminator
MGRGVGFQKKQGDLVDETKVEKIFSLESKLNEQFKTLLLEVPVQLVTVVEEVVHYSKNFLGKKINDNIYVTLTDHLNYAIERCKQGILIKNGLLWEIKHLYKEEYMAGQEAIKKIKETFKLELPEDEAGFVALHIVNAEMNEEVSNVINITKFMQQILMIVKYHFNMEFDEDSLNYYRFVTHLKFFAQRIFNNTHYENNDDYLYIMIKEKHKEASECSEKIKDYIKKEYNHELTNEEMLYLTLHIERVVKR